MSLPRVTENLMHKTSGGIMWDTLAVRHSVRTAITPLISEGFFFGT